jgi:hypothetical protein
MKNMSVTSSADIDIVAVMLHQEKTNYNKVDLNVQIDQERRRRTAQSMYQACKKYKLSNETVEVAMNMLDRFLVTPAGEPAEKSGRTYHLAYMTCLYTAAKAHETQVLDEDEQVINAKMFQAMFRANEIEQMELTILTALQYRVHPPTPTSFVQSYLDVLATTMLIPSLMDPLCRRTVMEISAKQVQEAVSLNQFALVPASVIGYCCLVNSLEATGVLDDTDVRIGVEWFLGQFVSDAKALDLSEYMRLLRSVISGTNYRLDIFKSRTGSKGSKSQTVAKCERRNRSPKSVTMG